MQISLNDSITAGAPPQSTAPLVKKQVAPSRGGHAKKRKTVSFGTPIFVVLLTVAFIWGWLHSGEYLIAESGLGYALGIAGAVSMLVLLAYPLRKRFRLLRLIGSVSFWFRLHMELGLIGPLLILYHANFGLGSTNSNVALWSMLIVAGSGVAGRYFYTKIHRGLYGKRAEMRELTAVAAHFREALGDEMADEVKGRIDDLEKRAFATPKGMMDAARQAIVITAQARRMHARLRRKLKTDMKVAKKAGNKPFMMDCRAQLSFYNRYFQRVEQAAELSFYERLFAAWHILHLPLFFLLIITAIIHVIAVHLY